MKHRHWLAALAFWTTATAASAQEQPGAQQGWGWGVEAHRLGGTCEVVIPYNDSVSVVLRPPMSEPSILLRFAEGAVPEHADDTWTVETVNGNVQFFHAEMLTGEARTLALGTFISPTLTELMLGTDRLLVRNGHGWRAWVQVTDLKLALLVAGFCETMLDNTALQ